MTKRRLTKQQRARIKKQHDKNLIKAETDSELRQDSHLGFEQTGILLAHYSKAVSIEGEDKNIYHCKLRQNIQPLVVGDRVVWRPSDDGTGVVVALVPRTTVFMRPDQKGKSRPIAANINQMFIVIAPDPAPTNDIIDRYLVAAEHFSIEASIILNKVDTLSAKQLQDRVEKLKLYHNIGYTIIQTSAKNKSGMQELGAGLQNHTSIFVGQSGVGKSSLISSILPEETIRVGTLSSSIKQGKHTTTTARLYHLPQGGDLIDSPGIRDFKLHHLAPEQVLQAFKEFRPYLGKCKFRDCSHEHEPDCAILKAIQDEAISQQRLDNYRQIKRDFEHY